MQSRTGRSRPFQSSGLTMLQPASCSPRPRGCSEPAQPAAAESAGWGSLPAELIETVASAVDFQQRWVGTGLDRAVRAGFVRARGSVLGAPARSGGRSWPPGSAPSLPAPCSDHRRRHRRIARSAAASVPPCQPSQTSAPVLPRLRLCAINRHWRAVLLASPLFWTRAELDWCRDGEGADEGTVSSMVAYCASRARVSRARHQTRQDGVWKSGNRLTNSDVALCSKRVRAPRRRRGLANPSAALPAPPAAAHPRAAAIL